MLYIDIKIIQILKIKNENRIKLRRNIWYNILSNKKELMSMATSSFTRKIIVSGKEATDMIIDAITSDTDIKKDRHKTEEFIAVNRKRGRASLEKFASHYKKLKK